jgi:hypothetical protein
MGSVYMPYDSQDLSPQEEVKKLTACGSDKRLELLLGCDANSHHEFWGSIDVNQRVEIPLNFIMHTTLHILNTRKNQPS